MVHEMTDAGEPFVLFCGYEITCPDHPDPQGRRLLNE